MANDALHEVRYMVQRAIEGGLPYLDEDRCALLIEAADEGDLFLVHDILVEGMIELRGIDFTRKLLQEVDSRQKPETALHRLN